LTTTLDIAALVAAVALPAVLLIALIWFHEPLTAALKEIPKRLESVSVAGITIRLAEARPGAFVGPVAKVDLRRAGTPQDVDDSVQASFYEQIKDPARIDYAIVDLGEGESWLSSRLFILSIILRRMRGLRAVVFVATVGSTRRRFIGVCSSEVIRWRLAARWPRFESALAAAELHVWGHPYEQVPAATPDPVPIVTVPTDQLSQVPAHSGRVRIVNDDGRMETAYSAPEAAVMDLLRDFLAAIQRGQAPDSDPDWTDLPESDPPMVEFAMWLDVELLEQLLSGRLDQHSIRLRDLQSWSEEVRTRAVLEHQGDWIAVTRDGGVFDYLIDRRRSFDLAASGSQ
jgi:hypothetical protein